MRHRSNSGVRLDYYQRMVQKIILKHQNHCTGLIPAAPNHPHAWVRDNVYSILAVWGLALAYNKTADLDEDKAKAYELKQSVVKLMRGLLTSMMGQKEKVEKFKYTQSVTDAMHAKYSVTTGQTVVGDDEWGHLQIDATSLYLLILAEMTASGLQIIYTLDEVAFIQNLVFYIQSAYRTPDYGIWERGDKTNHGLPELNATSIGMAKAALEAINELDLFGSRGGPCSVIHVIPDEAMQCQAILHSVLPRESNSKETDAGLLSIISYPAFAVDDPELIELTKLTVQEKLQGRYGFSRFLRDGYKTPKEDPHRLYYESHELAEFENIECEWPMFYCYFMLDALFAGKTMEVENYQRLLEQTMIKRDDGTKVMPELYAVPADKVEEERKNPKSVDRHQVGKIPQMWGQSLYVLCQLLKEGFLSPGELDPLNRRLSAEPRPDTVVQVVILAEDQSIKEKLEYYGLHCKTIEEVSPMQVYPARVLSHLFSHLGRCKKLGLTGRPSDVVGILATSKIYTLGDKTLAFFPQFVDHKHFYLPLDVTLMIDMVKVDIQYLGHYWKSLGRPTLIFPIRRNLLDFSQSLHPALVATIKKLQSGYINGTRVHLGSLETFKKTACVANLTFLSQAEDCPGLSHLLHYIERLAGHGKEKITNYLMTSEGGPQAPLAQRRRSSSGASKLRRKSSVKGIIRRTCSIAVEPEDMPDLSHLEHLAVSPTNSQSTTGPRMFKGRMRASFFEARDPSPGGSDLSLSPPPFSSHPVGTFNAKPRKSLFESLPDRDIRIRETSGGSDSSFVDFPMPVPKFEDTISIKSGGSYKSQNSYMSSEVSEGSLSPCGSMPHSPLFNFSPPNLGMTRPTGDKDEHNHPHLKGENKNESFVHAYNDKAYEGIDCGELVEQLADTESLHEQADIIHFLYVKMGPEWETPVMAGCGYSGADTPNTPSTPSASVPGTPAEPKKCKVRDLLSELYDKAGHLKQWWLVRHTAGMLRKRVEDLAKAATDIIVRQKQLAVGLPPEPREKIITRPLPPDELANIIHEACGDDHSTAMLTQEILVYLAMFIRTEPKLFAEMLRLRVGLIIQVMASELARTLKCSGEEASDQLLNLSPFEMKTLLHHILSGKEFGVQSAAAFPEDTEFTVGDMIVATNRLTAVDELNAALPMDGVSSSTLTDTDTDRHGQWLRRRRLDGALNRVPVQFYTGLWQLLQRCHGLSIVGNVLDQGLTREMTANEMKFALQVEIVLNKIPQPEFRQLMVEAMMVLSLIVNHDNGKIHWHQTIQVDKLVHKANDIFIEEQSKMDGDVLLCCGEERPVGMDRPHPLKCGGTAGICQNFYDVAPSGRYGTLSYMCRAALTLLHVPTLDNGVLDCTIS